MPGVAFDARGGRLGRGRGHYDAALALIRPGAIRVGIAFDEQVVTGCPGSPTTWRVDVGGDRVGRARRRATDRVDTFPDA